MKYRRLAITVFVLVLAACGNGGAVHPAGPAATGRLALPVTYPGSGRPSGSWAIVQSGRLATGKPWQLWKSASDTGGVCVWLDEGNVYSVARQQGLDHIANCTAPLALPHATPEDAVFLSNGTHDGEWMSYGVVAKSITGVDVGFTNGVKVAASVVAETFVVQAPTGSQLASMSFSVSSGASLTCTLPQGLSDFNDFSGNPSCKE
jgi:hypothetical protein